MVVFQADRERTDRLFHALADATRRDIVAIVLHEEQNVSDLARRYPMSFAAIQKHVAVLERAELVTKQRRGRGAPKPPLKELGPDPQSGKPLVIKDGRFGPYVTDGETNASLRKGDTPEAITVERAVELLAERRAKSA